MGVDGILGLELKDMRQAHKELEEAIGNREEFKLKGCIMKFSDIKQEYRFQEHWRRKSTPSAVCIISFFFFLYKGISQNYAFMTPSQNIATTSFACVSASLLFVIIQTTYKCFHRWYDWISGFVIFHVVLAVTLQNFFGASI